jgi:hypothetical protein
LSYKSHAAVTTACPIAWAIGTFPSLPRFDTLEHTSSDFVPPEVINNTVAHGKDHVALFQVYRVNHSILSRRIGAIGAKLARTVKPVPLFRGLEDDFLISGSENEDLAIAQVSHI